MSQGPILSGPDTPAGTRPARPPAPAQDSGATARPHPAGTSGSTGNGRANGAVAAAKTVAEDVAALMRAEIDLAKAEVMAGARAKAMGAGMLVAAAVIAGLAALGLLLTAGFALSEVGGLPGWASALVVSVALLVVAAVIGLVGRSRMATELSLDTTKENVEEDVEAAKQHLQRRT